MASAGESSLEQFVRSAVHDFISDARNNSLGPVFEGVAWGEPLVGFSTGSDPLYGLLKKRVGPRHWTPEEAFSAAFPSTSADAAELTVASWALPHVDATLRANRRQRLYPSERWARSRKYGQECNVKLHERMVEELMTRGIPAVAPALSGAWREENSEERWRITSWSERHVAFISGLGTFGLCDGLITERGKAVRLGSIVFRANVAPTIRPYEDIHEYCLFFSRGICGKCALRCPAGSVAATGRDKAACDRHLQAARAFVPQKYGFDGYGCGLCQTGVPCEHRIPG
jgi:epoxyqueuosine reductase